MTNLDRYIAERVKQFRDEAGLTQAEVAALLGLVSGYAEVHKMEAARKKLTPEMIFHLATVLRRKVSEFFPEPSADNAKDYIQ